MPPPKVTSSLVEFVPRRAPLPCESAALQKVTEAAFGQRRKMLRQSLKSLGRDPLPLLAAAGIEPTARAEDIPVEGFVRLARASSTGERALTNGRIPFRLRPSAGDILGQQRLDCWEAAMRDRRARCDFRWRSSPHALAAAISLIASAAARVRATGRPISTRARRSRSSSASASAAATTSMRACSRPISARSLQTTVIVENQPGAGGMSALNRLYQAQPDGLQMMLVSGIAATMAQLVEQQGVAYDLSKVGHLGIVSASPWMWLGQPSNPADDERRPTP